MSLMVAGISGSPSSTSRSRRLLDHALDVARGHRAEVHVIDLSQLSADALLGRASSDGLATATAHVAAARLVVASTPVYRATYSGLLKVFFDQLPQRALAGTVFLGLATGGHPGHEGVLLHGLAPLAGSLDALVSPHGIFAVDASFRDGVPDAALLDRVAHATGAALAVAATLVSH